MYILKNGKLCMNFGQIISNSWLIMGFIMGGVEFLPNFFLGLTSQRLCWGHEWMYTPCRAKLWDHLGPPQQEEMQQILSNSWLIIGFIMGGVKIFSNFLMSLTPQRLSWRHVWACTPSRTNFGAIWDLHSWTKSSRFSLIPG